MLPPLTKSYNLYKCKDGFLSIAALSDAQWFGIFRALGLPEYIEDERFNNPFARSENMVELIKSLTIFETLTVDDALQKLQDEVESSKNTFIKFKWPVIDVSRKSVEETAASVIKIYEISNKNA